LSLKNVFEMFKWVVMNRAADDPLPPFTCQKAAQLTTKSLQNHACYHSQHKLRLVVGTQQQTKGRGLEHEEEQRTTSKD
jgi:hypothetical protein